MKDRAGERPSQKKKKRKGVRAGPTAPVTQVRPRPLRRPSLSACSSARTPVVGAIPGFGRDFSQLAVLDTRPHLFRVDLPCGGAMGPAKHTHASVQSLPRAVRGVSVERAGR